MLTIALTIGMQVVIPSMTREEALLECYQAQDNPCIQHKLIALDGDDVVGNVALHGETLAVFANNKIVQTI